MYNVGIKFRSIQWCVAISLIVYNVPSQAGFYEWVSTLIFGKRQEIKRKSNDKTLLTFDQNIATPEVERLIEEQVHLIIAKQELDWFGELLEDWNLDPIRLDSNSPYYRNIFPEDATANSKLLREKNHNVCINELDTIYKMLNILQCEGNDAAYNILKQEYKYIQSENGQVAFARSSMKKSDFEKVFLSILNAKENQAYHDELEHFNVALAIMKFRVVLDKNVDVYKRSSSDHKELNDQNSEKAYQALKQEYEYFTSDAGRAAFTRSYYMNAADREQLIKLRAAYRPESE